MLLTFSFGLMALLTYAQNTNWSTAGNIGIGTTSPAAPLQVLSVGSLVSATSQYSGNLIIQGDVGAGRSSVAGSSLEFVVPANLDVSNPWGYARIITIAGNSSNGDATGKMILDTRRMLDMWRYGEDLVIDGTGQIGVGVSTPRAKLHVVGKVLI